MEELLWPGEDTHLSGVKLLLLWLKREVVSTEEVTKALTNTTPTHPPTHEQNLCTHRLSVTALH